MASRTVSISAGAQVVSVPATVSQINIFAGVDACTVELSDKVGSGGTRKIGGRADANAEEHIPFPGNPCFTTGIYATITGTAPVVEIVYELVPGGSADLS